MKTIIRIILLLITLVVGFALFGAFQIVKEVGGSEDISVSGVVGGIREAVKNSDFYSDISEMQNSPDAKKLADCLPADSSDIGVIKMTDASGNSKGISGAFGCNSCAVEGREKISFEQSKYNMDDYIKQENISPESAVLYSCGDFEILIDNATKAGNFMGGF